MKHFFRTVVGKTILFLACLISACLIIAGVIGVVVMGENGIYTRNRESVFEESVVNLVIDEWLDKYNYGDCEIVDGVRMYESSSNLLLSVQSEDGTLIAQTKGLNDISKEPGEYVVSIELLNYDKENPEYILAAINRAYRYINGSPYIIYHMDEDAVDFSTQIVTAQFRAGLPVRDTYRLIGQAVDAAYVLRTWIFPICLVLGLITLASFIGLMCVAGRRKGDEEVHPGPLNVIPYDVLLTAVIILCGIFIVTTDEFRHNWGTVAILLVVGIPGFLAIGIGMCMSFAVRVKARNLISGLFITKTLKFIGKVIKAIGRGIVKLILAIPQTWKVILAVGIDAFLNGIFLVMAAFRAEEAALVFLVIKSALVLAAAVYIALKIRKIQSGARELAQGNLAYKIDTTGMLPALREHADNLNNISLGMSAAVEQRMKSERMKTELITNVSHDIKTPLTSIINYVGLIAKEDCDNEKHAEYTEVLKRQSEKLKKLIEDLVEASKASTGNLEVHPAPCDASVLLSQVSGEYEERLRDVGLTLVVKQPEEQLTIMADGRHMWRIFDNLMNNICKYSLTGSRVYLTLERNYDMAQFVFKNTSKEVLDISEEELMERFVRGDSSRNTEGNGLGLSIAKSLAQLQNGWLRIETDGDLFKAILTFPLVEAMREPEYHTEDRVFPQIFDDIIGKIKDIRGDSQVIHDHNEYLMINNDPVTGDQPMISDRPTTVNHPINPETTDNVSNTEPDPMKINDNIQ